MRPTLEPPVLRSEINVTPFVDVCLVLLIIFMVIVPILTNGPAVQLPETAAPRPLAASAKLLTLRYDGSLDLDGRAVTAGELPALLRLLHAAGERLQVRADRRLPYREVRAALAAASRAQFSGAELATLQQQRSAARP